MNTLFARVFLFFFLVSSAFAQQSMTIDTPSNVVQCEPTLLNWSQGVGPYYLSALPGSQPNAPALVTLGMQTGNSYTWVVNLKADTSAFLQLRDSTGKLALSGNFQVLTSSNSSCLDSSSAGSPPVTGASSSVGSTSAPTTGTLAQASGSISASGSSGATKASQITATSPTSTGTTESRKSSSAIAASYYTPVASLAMMCTAALALML